MRFMKLPAKQIFSPASLFCVCLLLVGCVHPAGWDWREYKVFCGMSYHNGTVSGAEWQRFCDEYVTAEFPDGYTTVNAAGYWKSNDVPTTIHEDSRIIVILAPPDAGEKVRRVAQQYRKLFHQESVLVTTSPTGAEFVEADSE